MAAKISGDKKKVMILVDQNEQEKKITALEGFDEKGNPKTKNLNEQADFSNFLNIHGSDSALEAFFKKLIEQAKNPSHTGLYLVTLDQLDKLIQIKDPEEFTKALEPHKVDPKEVLEELRNQNKVQAQDHNLNQTPDTPAEGHEKFKYDIGKIDPKRREELGLSDENFEKCARSISYGYKSPVVELNPILGVGDGRVATRGRIYLSEQPDGSLDLSPLYYKEKLNLDDPFMGVALSDDVKKSLLSEGHAGQIVNLEPRPGTIVPSYLSIDQALNRIEYLPVEGMKIGHTIKGRELSEDQHSALMRGEKVWVEGMTSRFGKPMDRYLQIDAANSNIKFIPRSGMRKAQEQTTSQPQEKTLIVRDRFLGVTLEKWQKEAIQANRWTYIKGMHKEGDTELRNGWVRPNHEAGRFDIYSYIPKEAMGKSIDLEYIPGENGEKNRLIIKGSEITPAVTDSTKQTQSQSALNPEQKPDNQPKRQQIAPPKPKRGKGQEIS